MEESLVVAASQESAENGADATVVIESVTQTEKSTVEKGEPWHLASLKALSSQASVSSPLNQLIKHGWPTQLSTMHQ